MSGESLTMVETARFKSMKSHYVLAALVLFGAEILVATRAPADDARPAPSVRPTGDFTLTEADRAHWSFQPVKRPAPPPVRDASQVVNAIDRFVLAKLAEKGLAFSPPAGKGVLIRRVTFDLIGLPPTPAEIAAFEGDKSPDAYEKLIDRLLASPHYGERWGRHWLDLARYGETDGFEYDTPRPNAWRYRDYVIRAFNADMPYDRFIRQQVAGDELWPDDPDARIATGFNILGPDMVDSSDQVQRHHNTLNDMTDTTALTFLGLTMGCARCHDHKFDPISQRDYYSLQAFFAPAAFLREQTVATPADRLAHEAAMEKFNANPIVRELKDLEAPVREKLRHQKLAKLAPEAQLAHNTPPEKRTAEESNLVLETEAMLAVSDKDVAAAMPAEQQSRRDELLKQMKAMPRPPALPAAMAIADGKGDAPPTFVLHRGEYSQPREQVQCAFPQVLVQPGEKPPARRADLANWLASPQNPLTARVMVNRIWQHHFGAGLVATPSDFGTRGQPPTHPELLDWLASEFVTPSQDAASANSATPAAPWSIKHMHKLMLMSAAYRQSSSPLENDPARKIDPENRLLWRMNRQRLEGEVIRDGILAISGQLNDEAGGPGVFPPIPADVAKGWEPGKDPRQWTRRSVYIAVRRNLQFPFLEVFDAPDSNLNCPVRQRSITAPQALMLLNSDDIVAAAHHMETRLKKEADSDTARITLAWQLALGRSPVPAEMDSAKDFLRGSPISELCRALFNLNEFVYVD